MAGLTVGTMIGYAASLVLGRLLQQRLPSLVGEAYFRKMQSWIERYGLLAFVPGAFHPNQLAIGFAILGYFRARAGLALLCRRAVWRNSSGGALYASAADLVARQNVVSSSNFQLYVAALFSVWFLYELFSRQPQNVP